MVDDFDGFALCQLGRGPSTSVTAWPGLRRLDRIALRRRRDADGNASSTTPRLQAASASGASRRSGRTLPAPPARSSRPPRPARTRLPGARRRSTQPAIHRTPKRFALRDMSVTASASYSASSKRAAVYLERGLHRSRSASSSVAVGILRDLELQFLDTSPAALRHHAFAMASEIWAWSRVPLDGGSGGLALRAASTAA